MTHRRPAFTRSLAALLGLLLAFWMPASASAAAFLIQPFTGELGTVPEDWLVRRRGSSSGIVGIAMFSNNVSTDRKGLLLQRPSTGTSLSNASAVVFYTGETPISETGVMDDFDGRIKLTLGGASSVTRGIVLRAQSTAAYADTEGYYLAITSTGLALYHNPATHTDPGDLMESAAFTVATGVEYRLEFSVEGNEISASIFSGSSELASLAVDLSDSEYSGYEYYSSGYLGLRSGYGSAADTYFYDLEVDAIPEPGAFAFLSLGGLGLWLAARRRKH